MPQTRTHEAEKLSHSHFCTQEKYFRPVWGYLCWFWTSTTTSTMALKHSIGRNGAKSSWSFRLSQAHFGDLGSLSARSLQFLMRGHPVCTYMGTFMPLHHRRHRRGLKTWFYRSGGSHSYDYSFFTMCVGRRAEWNTLRGIEDSTREALKNWLPTVASYPMMLCYICEMGWMTGCVRCKIEHSMVLGTVKMKRTHSRQRIHLFFNGVFNNISAFFIIIALPPGIPQSVWELPVGIRIGIYNNKNHWGRQWSNEKTIKILSYFPEESRLGRIRIHSLESWLESTYGDIIVRFEPDRHSLPKQRNRSYP